MLTLEWGYSEVYNEYMTYLFVKEYYGEEYAQNYLTELHIPLFEKKGTERYVKLIEMKYNDNHDVV